MREEEAASVPASQVIQVEERMPANSCLGNRRIQTAASFEEIYRKLGLTLPSFLPDNYRSSRQLLWLDKQ